MHVSPADFHMSHKLSEIINAISSRLFDFARQGHTFEELFESKIKQEADGTLVVAASDFQDGIFKYFG
jgi:hypothetical protein